MTIKEAAQAALDVQDACNLSGVILKFSEVCQALWDEANESTTGRRGTNWVNTHPISILFADKIAHLVGTKIETETDDGDEIESHDCVVQNIMIISEAFTKCKKMVQE